MKPYRIVVVVVAVAVLLCGCLGIGTTLLSGVSGWFTPHRPTPPVDGQYAVDLVYGFVVGLSLDHVDDAYAELCADTKRRYSPAAFASYVAGHPKVARIENDRAFQPPDTVTATLVFSDHTSQRHTFRIVVEDEQEYHVCGDPY